ncbi:hypothetical protein CK910_22870 [Aeromonas sp. CA23]|uniref:hypothetical protein n=1 Tax=Aeromonas sp. CA23 TaxID=2033032 RepID=UPI000BFCA81D|nr:hypothetical protein [Aeromonas sp. CA23]ATM01004.1 hypothetical protein CK910_22870 [Aeromonas sp. CA23]
MNKGRRNVTLGLLGVPAVAALIGCNSSNDSKAIEMNFHKLLTARLTAELNDESVASKLEPFIEEACFNMLPPFIVISRASNLIAFAFGNRPNDSGNPNELAKPGPMNESLAACCAALYRQKAMPMYVQWEIARYLDSAHYPDIPARDVISIEPRWDDSGKLIYLSTDGVVLDIISEYFGSDPVALGTTVIIGHRDHIKRCVMTCRSRKVDCYAPEGIELPVWYDEQSAQPWTRRRELYVLQDISAQLMMMSQANIANAYPNG